MEIKVGTKRFEDEYRKNDGNVQLQYERQGGRERLSGPVVYVRRELAIIRFCATVARNGLINDVCGVKGSMRNASQFSADAVR